GGSFASRLTRQDEQVVRQPGETFSVTLQLLDELWRLAVPPQICHVAAQRGKGGASSCDASARKRRSASRECSRLASIAFSVFPSLPTWSAAGCSGRRRSGSQVRSISEAASASCRSGRKAGRSGRATCNGGGLAAP